jgi:hypothetical protein
MYIGYQNSHKNSKIECVYVIIIQCDEKSKADAKQQKKLHTGSHWHNSSLKITVCPIDSYVADIALATSR